MPVHRKLLTATFVVLVLGITPAAAGASTHDAFEAKAEQIWRAAAPYYGQSPDSQMPDTRVVGNSDGPRPRTVRMPNGVSQARFTETNAAGLLNGADAPEEWLIHEWAHVFQQSDLTAWEGEGGAQAFARYVAPRVYEQLGIPFSQPWSRSTDGYLSQMNRVERVHGWSWVMHGQWWSAARFAG